MPAHALTTVLVLETKLNHKLIQVLKGYESEGSDLCGKLLRLLDCDNAKEEIGILKQIFIELRQKCGCSSKPEQRVIHSLIFLVHLYFVSTSKNPARRVLASFLQSLPSDVQEYMICPFIRESLLETFKQPRNNEDLDDPIRFETTADLRHNVNTMASLLDNFPLGEESLRCECLPALEYLAGLQDYFLQLFSGQLSPVQQNEMMHHCLETVKLTNRILQKAAAQIEAKVKDTQVLSWFQKIAVRLVTLDIRIIRTDDFLIDCKTTSAMNITLLMKTLSLRDTLVYMVIQTFFPGSMTCDQVLYPDWLTDLNLKQLTKASLTSSAYMSLCYGILALLPMESLTFTLADGKCLLLDVLLPEFLDLNKSCSEVGSKLLAAKAVCLLTQRVCNDLGSHDCHMTDPRLLARLHGESGDMRTVLQFVWTAWEDTVDAIRFTVKDVFDNVVTSHILASKLGNQADPDAFLHKMAKSIFADVSWSCKGKYGTLSSLVGHIGSARMLELHPGIATDVLQQMQEQMVSCYASDLYDKLSTAYRTVASAGGTSATTWQTAWVDPVLQVLCGDNKAQKKHVIEYVVPKLLKCSENTLTYMISALSTHPDTSLSRGQPHMEPSSRLGALIICLCRARALGQLQHLPSKSERRKESSRRRKERSDKQTKFASNSPIVISESELKSNDQPIAASSEISQSTPASEPCDDASQSRHEQHHHDQSFRSGSDGQPMVTAGEISKSAATCESPDDTAQSENGEQRSDQSFPSIIETSQSDLWYGIVDRSVLRQALDSHDEQIRLDAFALLCENQKTTETICDLEVTLIRGFIPYNLNNQSPAFRQYFLSHLKKFLSRMKESAAVLQRAVISRNDATARDCLLTYKTFLIWLQRTLLTSLYPGSVFARRTTCLGGLVLLLDIYGINRHRDNRLTEEFIFHDGITRSDVHTLLYCLTDTFEDSKVDAARIVIALSVVQRDMLTEDDVGRLLDVALTLSTSTRPQDSATAAYMFRVLLHQSAVGKLLKYHVTSRNVNQKEADNDIDDNQTGIQLNSETNLPCSQEADDIINGRQSDNPLKGETSLPCNQKDTVEKIDVQSKKSLEHHKISQHDNQHDSFKNEFLAAMADLSDIGNRQLLLMQLLLSSLQEQTTVAQSNLIMAAANRPLYPTMQCIRYCLAEVDFRQLRPEMMQSWRSLLSRFITLCLNIAAIVSPVVHNSSPEGNIPVEAIKGTALDIELPATMADDIARSHTTVMLMPEYLVVCCWRSIKEISLILGQLTVDLPIQASRSQTDPATGLLTHQQIHDIGEYFTSQLLESRHRGAFELAYAGFVKVTQMLWRSDLPELHRLPRYWLGLVMRDIASGDPNSRLCATRRSAGVPFYVQALVTTEPTSSGRSCFKVTMRELLALAFSDISETDGTHTAKVHALNILRAMYKDTRLADDVAPYVADGLKVAILGFKSPLWAVRNSATLLLSAMVTRIFGVKRSKDESSLSRKNCQTGRTFFHHYPSLYQFLLNLLQEASDDMAVASTYSLPDASESEIKNTQQNPQSEGMVINFQQQTKSGFPSLEDEEGGATTKFQPHPAAVWTAGRFRLRPALYPVLMVLGRLFPSVMEGTDTNLSLAAFIPHIVRCSSNSVLKTRMMAARALQPLVERSQVTSVFSDLMTLLPQQPGDKVTQNSIHGVLLQIKQLMGTLPFLSSSSLAEVQKVVVPEWTSRAHQLTSRLNPCLLTRSAAMEVSAEIVTQFGRDISINTLLCEILIQEVTSTNIYSSCLPGLSEFLVTVCKLSFQVLPPEISLCLSDSMSPDSGFPGCMAHMEQTKNPCRVPVAHILANDLMESEEGENGEANSSNIQIDSATQPEQVETLNQSDLKTNQSEITDSKPTTEIHSPSRRKSYSQSLTVEMMILNFLNSPVYEVRKACLNVLCNILIHKIRQDGPQSKLATKSAEASDDDLHTSEGVLQSSAKYILPVLESSKEVYEVLMTMALGGEGHHECLAKVFAVLQLHAACRQKRSLKSTMFPAPVVFDKLLKLINSYSRVEVCAAAIKYSGHFVRPMYSLIALEARGEYDYAQSQMDCLHAWAAVLQRYSRPEESTDAQLACAWALLHNAQILLCDPQGLFGPLVFTFWKILIDLLHVDDLEVKDVASSVVMEIQTKTKDVPHPFLAADVLIGQLLSIHGDSKMADCAAALIGWIAERDNDDDHQEERLFDKGEMNTYREEINFIQMLDKHLLHLVSSIVLKLPTDLDESGINQRDLSKITWTSSQVEDFLSFYKKLNRRGLSSSDIESLAAIISRLVLEFIDNIRVYDTEIGQFDFSSAYLKTNSYSKTMTEVYRMLTLVKYGLLFSVDDACRSQLMDFVTALHEMLATADLCRLVSDTFSVIKLITQSQCDA